jgi:hypothetical protein
VWEDADTEYKEAREKFVEWEMSVKSNL